MTSRNRGKKKTNLSQYSRLPPSREEAEWLGDTLSKEPSPIVIAIVGQSMVELELDNLLRVRLRYRDDATWMALTEGNGPFGTFFQKIQAAHALGCINDVVRDGLNTIRTIRNAFAHSKKKIDFSDELVVRELSRVTLPEGTKTKLYQSLSKVRFGSKHLPDSAFRTLCWVIATQMLGRQLQRLTAKNRRLERKQRISALQKTFPAGIPQLATFVAGDRTAKVRAQAIKKQIK